MSYKLEMSLRAAGEAISSKQGIASAWISTPARKYRCKCIASKNTRLTRPTALALTCWLSVLLLKFLHELNEHFGAFNGHGIVDGSAHAANRAVSFETDQIILLGFLREGVFQLF
jgi:hypothetical protein